MIDEFPVQYNYDAQHLVGRIKIEEWFKDLLLAGQLFTLSTTIHNDRLTGISLSPIPARAANYDRAMLVNILVYHRPNQDSSCGCGWAELGKSWPEHIANVYEMEATLNG